MTYTIRRAVPTDASTILMFIRELGIYEKLDHHITATIHDVKKTLFCDHPKAEVLIAEVGGEPAGFALFFHNYSTFLCKYGLYVEDIYVREDCRGLGIGKALLQKICALAVERDCGRVEWWCLDWNKPSIDFYMTLGAEAMNDWTVYRLDRAKIAQIANAL